LEISRTTVIKAVKATSPPHYQRTPRATSFKTVEPVCALLAELPDLPAAVLAERVGWTGSKWDNEGGIGRRGQPAAGVATFMGTLATKLVLLPPRDPESKGIVERRNGWFETSFLPGRTFSSPQDFNEQFSTWLTLKNARVVRTTGVAPTQRLAADLAAMRPLPPSPLGLGWPNGCASVVTTTCALTPTTTRSTRVRSVGSST
jgi:hypothetical protein